MAYYFWLGRDGEDRIEQLFERFLAGLEEALDALEAAAEGVRD